MSMSWMMNTEELLQIKNSDNQMYLLSRTALGIVTKSIERIIVYTC
jgi:hypothetical protein